MRRVIFSLIALLSISPRAGAEEGRRIALDQRVEHSRHGWARLIPTHVKLQYAGGMGFLSAGFGWDYGKKRRWESDIFIGYLRKHTSSHGHATLTLKQNYIPWRIQCGEHISIEPLYGGLYHNTIFGDEFWTKQPNRYPSGYYWFSTRMRIHVFSGCRATWHPKPHQNPTIREISLFFEVHSSDLYIVRKVGNSYLDTADIIGFSLGIKLQLY
uniref:hypothetical protein n=1 Tax=Alistipes sp. TaxID=1872444 RepID=UPI00405612C0